MRQAMSARKAVEAKRKQEEATLKAAEEAEKKRLEAEKAAQFCVAFLLYFGSTLLTGDISQGARKSCSMVARARGQTTPRAC